MVSTLPYDVTTHPAERRWPEKNDSEAELAGLSSNPKSKI